MTEAQIIRLALLLQAVGSINQAGQLTEAEHGLIQQALAKTELLAKTAQATNADLSPWYVLRAILADLYMQQINPMGNVNRHVG